MDQPKYWAFISYSHRDTRSADWLHKSLESYRPPRQLIGTETARGPVPKRLSPVFRDREELASATDLGTMLTDALAASRSQIVICSPAAAQSRWVNEEILAFKRLGGEDRIFCLIVDGEPNATDMPGRADEECFPPALRYRLGPNGRLSEQRTEPIAADARSGKDGKQNAKLKLIAGLLGVGFDALRRREQQRRNRRLVLVASGATVGMLVTSSLAAYALIEKRSADRQRERAEAEAETARQTTRFLVELFRISDPSEARGNAVTAREMLDKGAARIDRDLAKQPAIRATLLDTLGTVYNGLGLYPQAKELLDRAVATRRTAGVAQQIPMSVSLEHLGYLLMGQADYAGAEKAYREAIAVQSARQDDPQARALLARTLLGLGSVLEEKSDYAEADRSLRQALELQHRLYGDTSPDIAITLEHLARVMDKAGDLNAAIPVMRSALAMQREVHGSGPHPDVGEALNELAAMLDDHGDYDESEQLYRESLAIARSLFGDKHPELANRLNNLAGVLADKGDFTRAEAMYREALAMDRELLGDMHPNVGMTLNNIAYLQASRGDPRGALATERQALEVYRKLFPGEHPEVARIQNRIGFWLTETGQYAEAERELEAALDVRRRLLGPTHPDVASSLSNIAILQVARNRYAEAHAAAHDAREILTAALSANHWKTAVAESAEGAALSGLGRYAEAETRLVHSIGILGRDGGTPPDYRRLAQRYLDRFRARAVAAGTVAGTQSAAPAATRP